MASPAADLIVLDILGMLAATANHHDQHAFVTVITAKVKSYEKCYVHHCRRRPRRLCAEPGYEPIDAYSPERLNTITVDELLRDIELNRVPIMTTFQSAELAKRLGGIIWPRQQQFRPRRPDNALTGRFHWFCAVHGPDRWRNARRR
jgi:hypothetical protein